MSSPTGSTLEGTTPASGEPRAEPPDDDPTRPVRRRTRPARRPDRSQHLRLTRRGRRVLLPAAAVLVLATGLLVVQVVGWPDALRPAAFGGPPCTVSAADGDRAVDRETARRVTDAALRPRSQDRTLAAADRPLVAAVRGRDGALSCRLDDAERRSRDDLAVQEEGRSGLTPRAAAARQALRAAAGDRPDGGYAPGGVTTGHMPGSAHYEGRAVDVFFRPVNAANSRQGWMVAQWLVAHADDLDLANVIFDDRIWSASASASGWRPYVPPQGPTRNPVLRHLDHVHLDVERGA